VREVIGSVLDLSGRDMVTVVKRRRRQGEARWGSREVEWLIG
jgi:hypothetical protein